MQKLYLGKTNRVYLQTAITIDAVVISIAGPTGVFLKDSSEADIEDKACTLDVSTNKFYYDVILSDSTSIDDAYLYWEASLSGIPVTLEPKYSPEDATVLETISSDVQLVSPTYVMDNYLRGISPEDIESTFQCLSYYDYLREQIQAAQNQLEMKTRVYLTPRVITNERHDYTLEPIFEKYWTNRTFQYPIISVESMQLRVSDLELADIPTEWISIGNKKEGLVKVIPYAGGTFSYRLFFGAGFGLQIWLGEVSYVPDYFVLNYTAGLTWDTLDSSEKTDIKTAIARRAAINMLPNLDTNRGIASESKGIDGATAAISFTSSAMYGEHSAAIKEFKEQEKSWVDLFKGKYNKRLILDEF